MGDDFTVNFECLVDKTYTFSVKNPRDEQEYLRASAVFAEKLSDYAYKTFDYGEVQNFFTKPSNLNRVRILGGSYSQCVDVKFLIFKISTENYVDYTVNYKVYAGYPWDTVEKIFAGY